MYYFRSAMFRFISPNGKWVYYEPTGMTLFRADTLRIALKRAYNMISSGKANNVVISIRKDCERPVRFVMKRPSKLYRDLYKVISIKVGTSLRACELTKDGKETDVIPICLLG